MTASNFRNFITLISQLKDVHIKIQSTDLTKNASAVYSDTELVFTLPTTGVYFGTARFFIQQSLGSGQASKVILTASGGGAATSVRSTPSSLLSNSTADWLTTEAVFNSPAATGKWSELQFMLFVTTAGTFTFQFAQNVAEATDHKFLTNSTAWLFKVS